MSAPRRGPPSVTRLHISVEGADGQLVISGPMPLLRELLLTVAGSAERPCEPIPLVASSASGITVDDRTGVAR